jgi:hypothetical protein
MCAHYRIAGGKAMIPRPTRRPPIVGRYTLEEVALAARNSGMPLEALRHEVTPAGLHYSLIHFDIPQIDARAWRLRVGGQVERALALSLEELRGMRARTARYDGSARHRRRRFCAIRRYRVSGCPPPSTGCRSPLTAAGCNRRPRHRSRVRPRRPQRRACVRRAPAPAEAMHEDVPAWG